MKIGGLQPLVLETVGAVLLKTETERFERIAPEVREVELQSIDGLPETLCRRILEMQLEKAWPGVQVDVLTIFAFHAVDVDAPEAESEATLESRIAGLLSHRGTGQQNKAEQAELSFELHQCLQFLQLRKAGCKFDP